MTALRQKPRSDGGRSGAGIDAAQMADIKAGREFSKKRRSLEASLYRAKFFLWEAGGKPAAMEEWAQKVMALDLSRKAVKAAWTLTYVFNSTDGACFEKKSTLAARAGLSEQALKDGLTELEKMSLIKRQKEKRQGKILTVIYPAEPVLDGSSQPRQKELEPSSLSRRSGSSLPRQDCRDTQDPCIPERSKIRSLDSKPESTVHYIKGRRLPEEMEAEARSQEYRQYDWDDSDIPF